MTAWWDSQPGFPSALGVVSPGTATVPSWSLPQALGSALGTRKVFPSINGSPKSRSGRCPGGNCEVSSWKKCSSCGCHLPEIHPGRGGEKGAGMGSEDLRGERAQISAAPLPARVTPSSSGRDPCSCRG